MDFHLLLNSSTFLHLFRSLTDTTSRSRSRSNFTQQQSRSVSPNHAQRCLLSCRSTPPKLTLTQLEQLKPPLCGSEKLPLLSTKTSAQENSSLSFVHKTDRFSLFRNQIHLYHTTTDAIMGATDVLSRKSGVIVGDDVLKLFNYAQEKQFAIPAIVSIL